LGRERPSPKPNGVSGATEFRGNLVNCTEHLRSPHATHFWFERRTPAESNGHEPRLSTVRVIRHLTQSPEHGVKELLATFQSIRKIILVFSDTLNSQLISSQTKANERLTKWTSRTKSDGCE
jgi:hypothetical protein